MVARLLFTLYLICLGAAGFAQDQRFIDFDRRLAQAQGDPAALRALMAEVEGFYTSFESAVMTMGGKTWTRIDSVPVHIRVTGDWGGYVADCTMQMQFIERPNADESTSVTAGSWGGHFEAGYTYRGANDTQTIVNYKEEGADDRFHTFVSGDMLFGPDCSPGSPDAPEIAENARMKEIEQANIDCTEALLALFQALALNAPYPGECMNRDALLRAYAEDIQVNSRNIEMMQKCSIEVGFSFGAEDRVSAECLSWMESYSDVVEAALGLCDMYEEPTARLTIIDPRPQHFKAQYSFDFERTDCKTLNVEAFINLTPSERFEVEATFPTPDECLMVDYVRPSFRVIFNQPINSKDIETLVRLRTQMNGGAPDVPIRITDLGSGILDIAVDQELAPLTFHWLEIKDGEDGLRSLTDLPLDPDERDMTLYPAVAPFVADGYRPAVWFHTTAVSDLDSVPNDRIGVRAGIYQVARDAQLIRERPTATRVWFDWPAEEAGDDRLREICLNVKVSDYATGAEIYPAQDATIKPTDDYTDDERLNAEDTVNFFGWRPTGDETEVVVQAKPQIYWHAPESQAEPAELLGFQDVRHRRDDPVTLTLKYGYLQVADFETGISNDLSSRLDSHMSAAKEYLWQMAPIRSVNLENLGGVSAASLGLSVDSEITSLVSAEGSSAVSCLLGFCKLSPELRVNLFEKLVEKAAVRFARQNCQDGRSVCLLVIPPLMSNHRDVTASGSGRGVFVSSAVLGLLSEYSLDPKDTEARRQALQRYFQNGADVAHEVGHSFGLSHIPLRVAGNDDFTRYARDGGIFEGIDGVRMRMSGTGGFFKSTETGNPETPRFLAPLMFPNLLPKGATHIVNDHYRTLTNNIYGGRTVWGQDVFSDGHPHTQITYTEYERRIMQSRLSLFGDFNPPDIYVADHAIGHDPEIAETDTDGIMLRLGVFRDENGASLNWAAAPEAVRVASAPAPMGDELTFVVWSGTTRLTERSFDLAADSLQDLAVFLPLDTATQSTITAVSLMTADGETRWQHDIGPLPDGPVTYAVGPDDTGKLSWHAGTGTTRVMVGFDDGGTLWPVGMTTDSGEFAFSLADKPFFGPGRFVLTFDNGLARKTLDVAAQVATGFGPVSQSTTDDPLTPEITLRLNRAVAAPLPSFDLTLAGVPTGIPVIASAIGDQVFLRPATPLAPCETYEIAAAGDIIDIYGVRMRGNPAWTISATNADADCGPTAVVPETFAQIVMSSDTGDRSFDGDIAVNAGDNTITLSFPRQTITLIVPSLETGAFALASVDRGETRRDLVLRFEQGDASDLRLDVTNDMLNGAFSVQVAGGTLTGTFAKTP